MQIFSNLSCSTELLHATELKGGLKKAIYKHSQTDENLQRPFAKSTLRKGNIKNEEP